MTLKTYEAPTMAEALAEVKRDLGRDAVILHTRSYRKGLLGLWGRHVWEVTASPNLNVPQRIGKGSYVSDRPAEADRAEAPADEPALAKPRAAAGEPLPDAAEALESLSQGGLSSRVDDIHRMVEALLALRPRDHAHGRPVPPRLEQIHAHLLEQEISPEAAGQLVQRLCMDLTGQQLEDQQLIRTRLGQLLAEHVRTVDHEADARAARSGHARVISLIGPTGVGKTTTIAKLAANYKLRGQKKVGLITIDTYRIAAVDQLRTYANIIEVPLRAVLTAGELHQAVQAMSDMDVVLIDTAGRSQNNRLRLSELRTFLGAAEPDEVHLVISATGNRKCTLSILERFLPLGANRLIVTKLDEAATFGVFVYASAAGAGPLSYVTTGQTVPDDIRRAKADGLAECILGGRFGDDDYAA